MQSGKTPLIVAAEYGNANVVKILLTNKANIEAHAKVLLDNAVRCCDYRTDTVNVCIFCETSFNKIMSIIFDSFRALKMAWRRHR